MIVAYTSLRHSSVERTGFPLPATGTLRCSSRHLVVVYTSLRPVGGTGFQPPAIGSLPCSFRCFFTVQPDFVQAADRSSCIEVPLCPHWGPCCACERVVALGTMTDNGGYGSDLRVLANPQNGRPTSLTNSTLEPGDPSYDNSIIHKVGQVVRLDWRNVREYFRYALR